jgi:hypothetical protein
MQLNVPLAHVTVLLPKVPDGGEGSRVIAACAVLANISIGTAAVDSHIFFMWRSFRQ